MIKLISRKIWVVEKSWKFHTVQQHLSWIENDFSITQGFICSWNRRVSKIKILPQVWKITLTWNISFFEERRMNSRPVTKFSRGLKKMCVMQRNSFHFKMEKIEPKVNRGGKSKNFWFRKTVFLKYIFMNGVISN